MNISIFNNKIILDELKYKNESLYNLSNNVSIHEMLNMIVYGHKGIGKTTQIYAFLAKMLDKKVYDLKNNFYEEDKKKMMYKSSIYHLEIDCIQLGSNDKLFFQTFLKTFIESYNVYLNLPRIILIKNVDTLNKLNQLILRKYIDMSILTSKFILEVSNVSKITDTLKSRLMIIKIKPLSMDEIKEIVIDYAIKNNNNINEKNIDHIISEISKMSVKINLKKIFGFYHYFLMTNKQFKLSYHEKFKEIIDIILLKKISFTSIQKMKDIIHELYINVVSMNELMEYIFLTILYKNINNEEFIRKLLTITSECNIRLEKGNKDCIHMEYYIISIINLIHNNEI